MPPIQGIHIRLLTVVYRNGSYWVFNSKSLFDDFGRVDDSNDHVGACWLVVRM